MQTAHPQAMPRKAVALWVAESYMNSNWHHQPYGTYPAQGCTEALTQEKIVPHRTHALIEGSQSQVKDPGM